MRSIFARFENYYKIFAVVLLNAAIFLLLLNYAGSFILKFQKNISSDEDRHLGLFKYKEYNPALAPVYPHLKPEQVSQLLKETRAVSLGYQPYVQFSERPCSGKYVNVDAQGFRPVRNQSEWPPNADETNIFVFGGSTVFGYGVTDVETIASRIQEKLVSPAGKKINVFNLGRCSYIFPQEVVFLERLLASRAKPGIVIFIDGLNDFAHYEGIPGFTQDLTRFMETGEIAPFERWVADWPISKLFRSEKPATKSDKKIPESEISVSVYNRYLSNKKVAEALAKEFGVKALFVWQPVPVYKYDQQFNIFKEFNYSKFLPYLKPGYEAISKEYEMGRFGENFLWLADMQENLKEALYVDAVHYSAKMSEMIAERIVEKIISQGLLN